ncbi:MAG: hypothetical protein GF346_02925 [Candidatus Eisenbacteria bacterium]|nr:hypothetical protein [Candidatus Latescibacterota bacterium]MBD3301374.1 hypothetical protein [Candidatus Eisenbacteria bacterium]
MNGVRRILAILVVIGAAAPVAYARDALFAVDSRGTSAVAVGDSGRQLYSWPAPHNEAWYSAPPYVPERFHSVTTTAGGYLAVGSGGRVMRSIDQQGYGTRWIPENSRTSRDLHGVTHAGDRIAAVGEGGVVLYKLSQSEGEWLQADPADVPTERTLRAVAGNPTYAVAVGDSGTVLWSRSSNLMAWEQVASVAATEDFHGIGLGPGAPPGRFWAVGDEGVILRSTPNVQEWDRLDSPTSVRLHDVAFSGTYGVAVGEAGTILYSNGGQDWTAVDSGTSADLYGVGYTGSGAGGGFVAVGDANVILWSRFGNVWNDVVVGIEARSWGAIRSRWLSAPDEP